MHHALYGLGNTLRNRGGVWRSYGGVAGKPTAGIRPDFITPGYHIWDVPSAQNLFNNLFVLPFVACLKPHLGVLDDASGVQNVCGSAVGILLAQIGTMAVEDWVGHS